MEDSDIPEFRRAVRAHLAERPSVAQPAETIHRHLRRQFDCSLADTAKACAVLEALNHLKSRHDELGGNTKYYQATAAGILAHERGE